MKIRRTTKRVELIDELCQLADGYDSIWERTTISELKKMIIEFKEATNAK